MKELSRYAALLRGINVGGHKPVKMEELTEVFGSLKFKNIKTLIASGNVLFETTEGSGGLAAKIEKRLKKSLGFDIPVMVRSLKEIEAILKLDPFKRIKPSPDVKNYVAFLYEEPKVKVKPPKAPPGESWEILLIKGREVYVTTRKKADGHNGFPNNFIEKDLGVSATTRNWNTVLKLSFGGNPPKKKWLSSSLAMTAIKYQRFKEHGLHKGSVLKSAIKTKTYSC